MISPLRRKRPTIARGIIRAIPPDAAAGGRLLAALLIASMSLSGFHRATAGETAAGATFARPTNPLRPHRSTSTTTTTTSRWPSSSAASQSATGSFRSGRSYRASSVDRGSSAAKDRRTGPARSPRSSLPGTATSQTLQWNEPVRGPFAARQVDFNEPSRRWHTTQLDDLDNFDDLFPNHPAPARPPAVPEESADEGPADEGPTDEAPTDEAPADEGPADERPADERPADEGPADEGPADEGPVDEGQPEVWELPDGDRSSDEEGAADGAPEDVPERFDFDELDGGEQPDLDGDRPADRLSVDAGVEYRQRCRRDVRELRAAKLADISLDIRPTGTAGQDYPRQCELEVDELRLPAFRSGDCDPHHLAWAASGLCHKPLYFQDAGLERYGHSTGFYTQPLLSAAHFFGTLPILPYKMGLRSPNECVYTLGHYRSGNCAPYIVPAIPFTWRAGLYQAGATVGAAYLLP